MSDEHDHDETLPADTCLHCVLGDVVGQYAVEVMGATIGMKPTPAQREVVVIALSRLLGEWYGSAQSDEERAALSKVSRFHVARSGALQLQIEAALAGAADTGTTIVPPKSKRH